MSEYRVGELAEAAGVTVETLRSYQSKGLLPPPRHSGRVAVYRDHHLERLRQILDLKAQGHSLRTIAILVHQRPPGPVDVEARPDEGREQRLTLREVAVHTRMPPPLLRSLVSSGVLQPRQDDPSRPYTTADVRAVRMLLALFSGGLPIEEFMAVAHTQIEAAKQVAAGATELFFQYVRQPMVDSALADDDEAGRLVAALATMLEATSTLISYNVQRRVLNGVLAELERQGATRELAALRREAPRRSLEIVPA